MHNAKLFRCQECDSPAHYGNPGDTPRWCDMHKVRKDGVIFKSTKECCEPGCRQYATHGSFRKSLHCSEHATDEDISLIEHTCVSCNLVDVLIDGKCEHCAGTMLRNRGFKQRAIKHLLDMTGVDYKHEHCVPGTRLVTDFLIMYPSYNVALEVDEDQHSNSRYSTSNPSEMHPDDDSRMRAISQADSSIKVIIRYNPDGYLSRGVSAALDGYLSRGVNAALDVRYATIMSLLRAMANMPPPENPKVVHLFFNGYTFPEFNDL